MSQNRKCYTPTCDNTSTPRTNFCQNCGANINMWLHRPKGKRLERKEKLALYIGRMGIVERGKK